METDGRVMPPRRRPDENTDQFQLQVLFETYGENLKHHARKQLGQSHDGDDAEDVVQDALIKFLVQQNRARAAGKERLTDDDRRSRLLMMVRDEVMERRRKTMRDGKLAEKARRRSELTSRWTRTRSPADDAKIRQVVDATLNTMSAKLRVPWILVNEWELTADQASVLLNKKVSTVRASISRANWALGVALEAIGITPDVLTGRTDA